MTPTSGAAPYNLSITFEKDNYFGNGYRLEVYAQDNTGSCPFNALSGILSPSITSSLLTTGSAVANTDIASGVCRAYTAAVVSDDNVILQSETIFIDNVV